MPDNPPPRMWHAATCHHKHCNCYDATSHEKDGRCRHCRRIDQTLSGADPITRHPEGM